ncbi:UDP-N-acetylmuramoyl-L-alanine--D-glutamate ligase [Salidesulfovibrio brasiliensis]|uniref:UDP-N-acetylmuramoyl-L-alanine--D-glutamate ligase n=1 Tax=Salidesulfovibrio brasiliensis TaxID=221711 RepID=UPI0006D2204F|nr:UDP-N-acetylmuramoyl-L-alanine--D-glutamate ligase [Salidesulfovibrio brasiliensis]
MSRLDLTKLEDLKAVVIGAERSGRAAARFLAARGADVTLLDCNEDLDLAEAKLDGVNVELGDHTPEQFAGADIVVPSPGADVRKVKALEGFPAERIVAEMELGFANTDIPVLAVTGTNGKTTTTMLCAAMLEAAGEKVFAGGNLGTPLTEFLLEDGTADVLVLEISSFQLMHCHDFRPRSAVLLNFSGNHLDWHESMEEYLDAKLKLFANQTEDDLAVIGEPLYELLEDREITRAPIVWSTCSQRFQSDSLPGEHNCANAEAAWQAVKPFGVDREEAVRAVKEFPPQKHRIEILGQKSGVTFVNDTKATTFEAVAAAVKTFKRRPVRLLMGGVYKGGDMDALVKSLEGRVRQVGLYGGSRDIFEKPLSGYFSVTWDSTLERAVKRQYSLSSPGDVILLSPGTSSFDQYANYMARGEDFRRIFEELED